MFGDKPKLAPNGKEYVDIKYEKLRTSEREASHYIGKFTMFEFMGLRVLYQIISVSTQFKLYMSNDKSWVDYEPKVIKDSDIDSFQLRPIKIIMNTKEGLLNFSKINHKTDIDTGIVAVQDSIKCQKIINKLQSIRAEKEWEKEESD